MTDRRLSGDRRYRYDRNDKTVTTGKRTWPLKDVPPHVIYEWIREDRIFKGVLQDWLAEKVFWKKRD